MPLPLLRTARCGSYALTPTLPNWENFSRIGCVGGKTTHAAWRSKPSWYAVSTEDRTINPDLERFMAKRMGAKTIEVKSSHVSLISHPDTIANLILEAAGQA